MTPLRTVAAGQAFWLGRAVSKDPAGKEWGSGYEVVANLSFAAYEVLPNVVISTLAQSAVQVMLQSVARDCPPLPTEARPMCYRTLPIHTP